jgi:hypothetical protein
MFNQRRGIFVVFVTWALLSLVGCSVYDGYEGRTQATFRLNVVDSTGAGVPSSEVTLAPLYCFVNGLYSRMLTPEADGTYRYVFNSEDSVCLVSLAGSAPSEYSLAEPREGESIHNVWLNLNGATTGEVSPSPAAIYYGSWTGTGSQFAEIDNAEVPLTLRDLRDKIRVLIRGVHDRFGDGEYRVVIDGLRGGLDYDGMTATAMMASFELPGAFIPGTGDWLTKPVTALPSCGGKVTVRIYKKDGQLIYRRSQDDNGVDLVAKEGGDQVFVITASMTSALTLQVQPFDEVFQNSSFQ